MSLLPPAYTQELNTLNRLVLKNQPSDILQFCANFFNRRLESQRAEFLLSSHLAASTSAAGGVGGAGSSPKSNMSTSHFPGMAGASSNPFSGSAGSAGFKPIPSLGPISKVEEEEEEDTVASPTSASFGEAMFSRADKGKSPYAEDRSSLSPSAVSFPPTASSDGGEGFPSNYSLGRRTSVSAESLNPTHQSSENWSPPFHQKTSDQLARLRTAIAGNFLFAHLDDEQTSQVLGALQEKPIPAKDIKVIIQGDVGDYFYIVEKGVFDVYINAAGSFQPGPEGIGKKVADIGPGGSFGELALMYNAPRAATVISAAPASLWALDRVTFRRILMDSSFQRRQMYEKFLEEVPLLSSLESYERAKIADALDTRKFQPGSTIIQEGDPGEAFFILESGTADVYKRGTAKSVMTYNKGDYFGELALLNDAPRAASVISTTETKVATLGKDGFQRLLGPVEGIMRRNDPSKLALQVEESLDPLSR
ncbi:MAG: hypothetical protein M1829_002297 [Trizodia sp. TS-e1964]|nr:MAG: hypothetical protein M1829_002297 [Trizodia sp. TS-e1964]